MGTHNTFIKIQCMKANCYNFLTKALNINLKYQAKKINKCFSGHFFEKQMRQADFYFFISQKTEAVTLSIKMLILDFYI